MNVIAKARARADAAQFDVRRGDGVWAIHHPKSGDPVRRRVIVSEGVQRQGDQMGVMETSTELDALLCEGPKPRRGDMLTEEDSGRIWTVDGEITSDESVCTVRVRA